MSVCIGSSSHDRGADDCNEEEEEDIEEERGEDDGFLSTEQLESRICCNPLSEEYLSWKKNLIANAREQLLNTPSLQLLIFLHTQWCIDYSALRACT